MKKLQWPSPRPAVRVGAAGKQSAAPAVLHKALLQYNIKLAFLVGLAVFLFIKSGSFSTTYRHMQGAPNYDPSHLQQLQYGTHLSFSSYKEKATTSVHSSYTKAALKSAKRAMANPLAQRSHAEKSHIGLAEKNDTQIINAAVANVRKKLYAAPAPNGNSIANHMEKHKAQEGVHMTMSTVVSGGEEDYSNIIPLPIDRKEDNGVHAEEKQLAAESIEPKISPETAEAIEAEGVHIFFSRRGTQSHKENKTMKPSEEASLSPSNSEHKADNATQEEDNLEAIRNLHTPFQLEPKITDWDQQRQAWLHENSNFAQRNNNASNILLVSGSRPTACDNPYGDHYLLKFFKNKMDYCRLHNIAIFYNMAQMDDAMTDFWTKLPLIRKLMLLHPEIEWIWWMDSDAMLTDMTFQIPLEKYRDYNLVIHGWAEEVYVKKSWIGLNAGIFLLRNCQWSLDLIDTWAIMGEKGKTRDEAGKILSETLSDRPWYMADDQSSLVYLLITQKERWESKVFLENSYYLHGYWDFLVDRYEELMESSHPGYGDDRWPFVTHFVGCKPCGKEASSYAEERCLKHMERAFNFADNQVLQKYGFEHKNLGSFEVKRITPAHRAGNPR